MKKIILFFSLIPLLSIAQVGIGTTDPRTTLDVVGAITNREVSFAVASNAVTIATETSLANITGSATATIAVTSFTPTVNGCRLIISNNTTGGFGATFAGMTIPNSQAIEFVYTNGGWKTTAGGTGAANNIYNSNGTLSGNRTVTQGASSLTFTGTGNTIFNSGNVGVGTTTPLGKLNVSGGLVVGSGTGGGNTTGVPFSYGNTTNSAIWFGNHDNTAASDYGVMYLQGAGDTSILNILTGDNASGAASDESIFIGNVEFTSGIKKGVTIKNGFTGIGTISPTAQLHTTGTIRFEGAGTPTLGRSLVTDATGLATWQNPLASNTNNTAITASATQVPVPSTNVQGAISDLATAIRTAQNSTIYNSNGTLIGNRIVTQGTNTLTFNSTVLNGFSVDGNTFSVDGANDRIGIGTTNPTKKLTVENGSIRPAIGNSQDAGISFPTDIGGGGGDEAFVRYYVESGENTKLSIGTNNDFDDDISFFQAGAERMNIYNGNVGIGINLPTAQLHTTGSVRFAGAGTPTLGRSLVTDATGLATWQNPLASNTNNTAIAASATQVAVASTNVQGAIGDLATAIRAAQNSTIYTSDGTLTGNRTVTQGANTLTFNSTAVNGFSVDGTTFSVDGANNRVGIGNIAPNLSLDVTSGNGIGTKVSNASQWDHLYLFSDTVTSYITAGGADNGLRFRVGSGASGTYGGQTYTTTMTMMPSGNIGIGTTAPNAPLQFADLTANRKIVLYEGANNNDHQFYGLGVNSNTLRYQVNSVNDRHIFYSGDSSTTSNELMRIQGNGRVGIGNANPLAQLDLRGIKSSGAGTGTGGNSDNPSQAIIPAGSNGTSRFNDWPAGWGGGISTYDIVGASTFMNANLIRSDFRLKNDIKNIDNSIFSNFMKIRPVTYFMKEQSKEMEGLQYGFIAQEIRDLFPSMVTKSTDPNGIIGMNYQALISPTIYVVQQQQVKIDELQKQVDSQNEKLSKMEEELKQIKQLLSK